VAAARSQRAGNRSNRGIGRAIAAELIELGANVSVVGARPSRGHATVQALGERASGVRANVTSTPIGPDVATRPRARPAPWLVHNAGRNVRDR